VGGHTGMTRLIVAVCIVSKAPEEGD